MNLPKIIGHESVKIALLRSVAGEHLPNAFCFVGPSGVGKRSLAIAFVAWDLCLAPDKSMEHIQPCGACVNCQRLLRDAQPDFVVLDAEGAGIKIEQIREIHKQCRFRPLYGRRRWILINDAENLTEQAQNALLHTLEEPSTDTRFLLITANLDLLLTTIRSRCRILRLGALDGESVKKILEGLGVTAENLTFWTSIAAGSPGRVVPWLASDLQELRAEFSYALLHLITKSNPDERTWAQLLLAKKLAQNKGNREFLIDLLQSILRDLAMTNLGDAEIELLNPDLSASYRQAKLGSGESVLRAWQAGLELQRDFEFHTNPELTFHGFLRKMGEAFDGR